MLKTIKLLLVICGILIAKFSMADDKIIIADYIIYPPYQMAEKGLTSDFINVLESRLPNLPFMSKRITKERLLAFLKQNKPMFFFNVFSNQINWF